MGAEKSTLNDVNILYVTRQLACKSDMKFVMKAGETTRHRKILTSESATSPRSYFPDVPLGSLELAV